jgi:hypothetical protein
MLSIRVILAALLAGTASCSERAKPNATIAGGVYRRMQSGDTNRGARVPVYLLADDSTLSEGRRRAGHRNQASDTRGKERNTFRLRRNRDRFRDGSRKRGAVTASCAAKKTRGAERRLRRGLHAQTEDIK